MLILLLLEYEKTPESRIECKYDVTLNILCHETTPHQECLQSDEVGLGKEVGSGGSHLPQLDVEPAQQQDHLKCESSEIAVLMHDKQ